MPLYHKLPTLKEIARLFPLGRCPFTRECPSIRERLSVRENTVLPLLVMSSNETDFRNQLPGRNGDMLREHVKSSHIIPHGSSGTFPSIPQILLRTNSARPTSSCTVAPSCGLCLYQGRTVRERGDRLGRHLAHGRRSRRIIVVRSAVSAGSGLQTSRRSARPDSPLSKGCLQVLREFLDLKIPEWSKAERGTIHCRPELRKRRKIFRSHGPSECAPEVRVI